MSFENGVVPANLHYKEPNPNSEGLINGTLKVVTEPTQLEKGIAALSNFGFGGACPLNLLPLMPLHLLVPKWYHNMSQLSISLLLTIRHFL